MSDKTRVLFICSRNRLRSPTAEQLFSSHPGIEVVSAGTAPDAEEPITSELIVWAELIFVMEVRHRRLLTQRFRSFLKNKKLVVLNIPDTYDYMDPELVKVLKHKVLPQLRLY
jgi:predicted protein tyrosine phosphatase